MPNFDISFSLELVLAKKSIVERDNLTLVPECRKLKDSKANKTLATECYQLAFHSAAIHYNLIKSANIAHFFSCCLSSSNLK